MSSDPQAIRGPSRGPVDIHTAPAGFDPEAHQPGRLLAAPTTEG